MIESPPTDLLAACGFATAGDPPTMTLDVLGHAVHVTVIGPRDLLRVEVRMVTTRDPGGPELEAAGLRAPGDTALAVQEGQLVARRSLLAPSPAQLHDAVHELGKTVVGLVRAEPLAEPTAPIDLAKPAATGTPAAATGTPAAVTAPPRSPAPSPVVVPAASAPAPAQPAAAPPDDGRYWCFVDQPTELHAAPGSSEVVALLMPGTWYPASHDDGVWVHIQHPSGAEGVVLHQAVTRA